MLERLTAIEIRYNELNELLMLPENINNHRFSMVLSKEQALLRDAYEIYQEYKKVINAIHDTEEMIKDPEMGEIAREELVILNNAKLKLDADIELILLPKDPNDGKNVIVEIRGAAGGDEANIFAGDLYRMYTRYSEKEGWDIEPIYEEPCATGGYSQIEFMIKGDNVYSKLKYESGAHRVQRVPETESLGRTHTSTSTVLVMPEADEVDVEIKDIDIKTDVYRSSGAGGQSVNTTDSAVRVTHIPTGVAVACQTERSQIKNKERAMTLLRSRVYEEILRKHDEEVGAVRKDKIGTGDRSEKIRTYNYPQNRVTDHRIGFTTKQLDRVMDGALDEIIQALITEDQARKLKGE